MSDADKVTNVLAVGLALADTLANAAIQYAKWQAMREGAEADGRTDFTIEELDAIHNAMHEATDRFLGRAFTEGSTSPT